MSTISRIHLTATDHEDKELEDETLPGMYTAVDEVRLSLAGNEADQSEGWGWPKFTCAKCGEDTALDTHCAEGGPHKPVRTPLSWAASAAIQADADTEMITVRVSLSTGGFVQMEVFRAEDGSIHVHTPDERTLTTGGETVIRTGPSAFRIV